MTDSAHRTVRVASAPVSFGVDEVIADDAWMPEPDQMLRWMADIGYAGTEMGPPGFLGTPTHIRDRLGVLELQMVGAFLPQHFSRREQVAEDRRWLVENLRNLRDSTAPDSKPLAVLCEAIDESVRLDWAGRIESNPDAHLDDAHWDALVDNLHAAAELCREHDVEPVFHPHAGTYIETAAEIDRLCGRMDARLVGLCLDTGHFRFGGAVPADAIGDYAALVRHVHIKDCSSTVRDAVAARGGGFDAAVRAGVFPPLGEGDADITAALDALRAIDYSGWIVIEQDQALTAADTPDSVVAGQRANLEFVRASGL